MRERCRKSAWRDRVAVVFNAVRLVRSTHVSCGGLKMFPSLVGIPFLVLRCMTASATLDGAESVAIGDLAVES